MEEEKTESNKEPEKGSETEELKKQLEDYQKLKEEYLAGWQRARADLLNYKKEEMERIGEFLKYGNEEFILKILPILDNFEVVETKLPEDLKKDDNVKGLLMLKNQLQDFLKSQGVEEIKSIGERFDPNFHEAIEEVETKNEEQDKKEKVPGIIIESGIILEEIQKGYTINGRLLRSAKVKISK